MQTNNQGAVLVFPKKIAKIKLWQDCHWQKHQHSQQSQSILIDRNNLMETMQPFKCRPHVSICQFFNVEKRLLTRWNSKLYYALTKNQIFQKCINFSILECLKSPPTLYSSQLPLFMTWKPISNNANDSISTNYQLGKWLHYLKAIKNGTVIKKMKNNIDTAWIRKWIFGDFKVTLKYQIWINYDVFGLNLHNLSLKLHNKCFSVYLKKEQDKSPKIRSKYRSIKAE